MTFPDDDCASRTAGNNSTVTEFLFRCGQKCVQGPACYPSASTSRCSNDTSGDLGGRGGGDRLFEKSGNKCETARK
jgi:hypothetical protein